MKRALTADHATDTKRQKVTTRIAVLSLAPEWIDILAALAVQPRTVHELTLELNLPRRGGTLGNRLKNMREAGLIDFIEVENGTRMPSHLYRLVPETIQTTAQDIRDVARQIEETAARIESFVAKKNRQSA